MAVLFGVLYIIDNSPAFLSGIAPLNKYELRDLFYSPYAQAGKDFFLAEVVYEAIGRFDDSMWTETAALRALVSLMTTFASSMLLSYTFSTLFSLHRLLNDSVGGFCFWIGLIFQSIKL